MLRKRENIDHEEVLRNVAKKNKMTYVEPNKRKKLDNLFPDENTSDTIKHFSK